LSLNGQIFFSEANFLSSIYDQRNYGFSMELRKPLNAFMYATLGYRLEEIELFNVDARHAMEWRRAIITPESEGLARLNAAPEVGDGLHPGSRQPS